MKKMIIAQCILESQVASGLNAKKLWADQALRTHRLRPCCSIRQWCWATVGLHMGPQSFVIPDINPLIPQWLANDHPVI